MKGNLHFLLFIFYDRSHSVCLQFLPYPSRFYVPAIETHFHFPTVAFRPYLWNASHKTRLLHLLRFLPIGFLIMFTFSFLWLLHHNCDCLPCSLTMLMHPICFCHFSHCI
ncbi:hypothetical protein Csa_023864 [Cucumis sativus]|nr:hypothetical protein Csa_023864 [Cucumis sativus]